MSGVTAIVGCIGLQLSNYWTLYSPITLCDCRWIQTSTAKFANCHMVYDKGAKTRHRCMLTAYLICLGMFGVHRIHSIHLTFWLDVRWIDDVDRGDETWHTHWSGITLALGIGAFSQVKADDYNVHLYAKRQWWDMTVEQEQIYQHDHLCCNFDNIDPCCRWAIGEGECENEYMCLERIKPHLQAQFKLIGSCAILHTCILAVIMVCISIKVIRGESLSTHRIHSYYIWIGPRTRSTLYCATAVPHQRLRYVFSCCAMTTISALWYIVIKWCHIQTVIFRRRWGWVSTRNKRKHRMIR